MRFTEPVFRPPQEADSLLLRGTQGCTHNKCHFCFIGRNSVFRFASPDYLEEELRSKLGYYRRNTRVFRAFLVGANPFALKADKLLALAAVIKKHLPLCPEISMHCRITDIARKSSEELWTLKEAGINHLYPGTENGNDEALSLMNKGATVEDSLVQLKRLENVGIEYTANYIFGMAGSGQGEVSGIKTAEMFNKLKPRRITSTGLTVYPNTPLAEMVRVGQFTESSELEKVEEMLAFFATLKTETVVDTRHYLNYINMEVRIPEERDAAVDRLKMILHTSSNERITKYYRRDTFVNL